MEYLDKTGVQTLWSKVKTKVQSVNKEFVGLGNVSNDALVKRTEMGAASGVATLDSNGKIPVEQLGNLDTVVAMVVTELPTTNIKTNKIYLVKDSTTEGDLYQEYLYVNNAWEKIGTHKQEVDLSGYAKYTDLDECLVDIGVTLTYTDVVHITYGTLGQSGANVDINAATETYAGVMTAEDKEKLNSLSNYTLPIASATALGGIKLGSGLSATSDGTVNVSADVVAGSVEWDSIKNKPTLLIGGETVYTGDIFTIKNNTDNGSYGILFDPDRSLVSSLWESEDTSLSKSVDIYSWGITATIDGTVVKDNVFMTDGTTMSLKAITTAELNEILV